MVTFGVDQFFPTYHQDSPHYPFITKNESQPTEPGFLSLDYAGSFVSASLGGGTPPTSPALAAG